MDWLLDFDRNALLFLNGKHSPFWDDIMWWASDTKIWIPIYVVLLINIILRELPYRFIFTVLFVAVAIFLSDQISNLIKVLVERPRPTWEPEIRELVHKVIIPNTDKPYTANKPYGFVSNHAANFFCMFTFLACQFKSVKWGLFLFACALIASYSRIYLGVHYPLDIICGAILGALIGAQCYFFKVQTAVYIDRKFAVRREKKAAKRKAKERKEQFSNL
jgi:undecaprenyl-diphosphatase